MAGYVPARLDMYPGGDIDVMPDICPGTDEHRTDTPRCFNVRADGDAGVCIYWMACTPINNSARRVHPTALRQEMIARSNRTLRCGVICMRGRSNRPAGC
jgi:hypothetical protein